MPDEKLPPPPKPTLPKEAPWTEIEAIIDGLKDVSDKLDALLAAMGVKPPPPTPTPPITIPIPLPTTPAPLSNKNAFAAGQVDVTSAGAAEQLPYVAIPDGFRVVIMAKPSNTGYIYLGNSKTNAERTINRFDRLEAGDSIALQITNLNLVWIDASVSGDGISYIVEQG